MTYTILCIFRRTNRQQSPKFHLRQWTILVVSRAWKSIGWFKDLNWANGVDCARRASHLRKIPPTRVAKHDHAPVGGSTGQRGADLDGRRLENGESASSIARDFNCHHAIVHGCERPKARSRVALGAARNLYLAHKRKRKRMFPDSDKVWEEVIAEDFDALRAEGC
jgi:hypothetical protein